MIENRLMVFGLLKFFFIYSRKKTEAHVREMCLVCQARR
jgi:hypothetical protein